MALATNDLYRTCNAAGIGYDIRGIEIPSDHCPIWAERNFYMIKLQFKKHSVYWLVLAVLAISTSIYCIRDPFLAYRHWTSYSLSIKAVDLENNQNVEKLIREKQALNLTKKEVSILSGLHWLLGFIDDDKNFDDVFSDIIILFYELTRSEQRLIQNSVAKIVLKQSLERAIPKLEQLFPNTEEGRWDFIGILPIIADYSIYQQTYYSFYQKNFGGKPVINYQSGGVSFKQAVRNNQYEEIGDYLIDTSFLHYYLKKTQLNSSDNNILSLLPKDNFKQYLKTFESFNYKHNLIDNDQYIDLAYLATHVVLVMTNYGETSIQSGINTQKVSEYIEVTYPKVRFKLGDLDLLAEYLQCLKIVSKNNSNITSIEELLFSLQRSNGSWGTASDFKSEPYSIFHPTWAVLTGLNHDI